MKNINKKIVSGIDAHMIGKVCIHDADTGEIVLERCNAIHPQNMALSIARSLSRNTNGYVFKMSFGNGGTFLNSSNRIIFRSPNTLGAADLYNPTYEVIVDATTDGSPVTNSVVPSQSPSPSITSVVTITCILGANEPAGQGVTSNSTTNPKSTFFFDEIGLKTFDGLLLTHLVFTPIEKTANRVFLITYTLTVSVS
jgi:hypothetical protein